MIFKHEFQIQVPDFPAIPDSKTRSVTLMKDLYIELDDFKEVGDKGYRRLTPNQSVGLRYASLVLEFLKLEKVSKFYWC